MQSAQQDMAAHRMGHGDGPTVRSSGQPRFDHFADQGVEILVIFGKVIDMCLAPVGQQPVRAALAAPIESDHGKPPAPQFVDHFEIFFDEFGLAVEQHADAARAAIGREIGRRAT